MISVDIPKDIREYKEKLVFGLTVRQLLSVVVTLVVCVPLYIWGRKFLGDDLMSWIIMGIAFPLICIGFYRKNGMNFEVWMGAILKRLFIYPAITNYKTNNFFREMQTAAEMEGGVNPKKMAEYESKATLERAYLLLAAEQQGEDLDMENLDEQLLTVMKLPINSGNNDDEKKKNKKQNAGKKSKAQIAYETVEKKRQKNPAYVPTKQEGKLLVAYRSELRKKRLEEAKAGMEKAASKNKQMEKRRKSTSYIPKSTQDDIPYIADFEEGLCEVEPNIYSKAYVVRDINYKTGEEEEQIVIFSKLGELYNSFPDTMYIQLCLDSHIVSLNEQEQKIFYKMRADKYDVHRKEYNKILKKRLMAGNNEIQKNIYFVISIDAGSPYEALLKFHRIDNDVEQKFRKIGTSCRVLTTEERLSLLHDKFRAGREGEFCVDFETIKKMGVSSKDYIAPADFTWKKDHFLIEDTYWRCMFINNLPSAMQDEFLFDLTDCDFPVMFTMGIQPVAKDKAITLVKRRLTGMEANKNEAEKRALRAGYSPETISHDLRHSYEQGLDLLETLQNGNQKLFFTSLLVMTSAKTLEDLNNNTEILKDKARGITSQIQILTNQQREGFYTTLPMGVNPYRKLYIDKALTTNSISIFMPFASQELFQLGGHYYGLNQITGNMVLCDRTKFKTPSGFVLGSSGSGKSFACKGEMLNILLGDDKTNLLVIDPEGEYISLAKVFGGTVLSLSSSSDCYINPMEMNENYGLDEHDNPATTPMARKKEKALQKKSDYIMSIVQCMMSNEKNESEITPAQRTIIDRAIKNTYENYLNSNFDEKYLPTLVELQDALDSEKTKSEDARIVAEAVEYFTRGSMNLFSHKSNLDFDNRFVVFSIRDLGKQLQHISLLIVLDFIWNRMMSNAHKKIRTYCYVDEIHVLFRNSYSEQYIQQLYKRGRKYGLVITGITQDCADLLKSEVAQSMIENSDFILMLNQKQKNLELLVDLLHISETQKTYVYGVSEGTGLLFAEKTIVPFMDEFPTSSYLYTLMSTKFGEGDEETEQDILEYIEKLMEEQEKREAEEEAQNIVA